MASLKVNNQLTQLAGLAIAVVVGTYALYAKKMADTINVTYTPLQGSIDGIKPTHGIASLEVISLGGVEQTILIRGWDDRKPLLLWLHGGPGESSISQLDYMMTPLEQHFVVVHWDQRGSGLSYHDPAESNHLNWENLITDTVTLTEQLKQRFGRTKILLMGHGTGGWLALDAVKRTPHNYAAVFLASVSSNWKSGQELSYRWALKEAQQQQNQLALQELQKLAPFDSNNMNMIEQKNLWLTRLTNGSDDHNFHEQMLHHVGARPEYNSHDVSRWMRGRLLHRQMISAKNTTEPVNLFKEHPTLAVPTFFLAGRNDLSSPAALFSEYYKRLDAPQKEIVWFEYSGKYLIYVEPIKLAKELVRLNNSLSPP